VYYVAASAITMARGDFEMKLDRQKRGYSAGVVNSRKDCRSDELSGLTTCCEYWWSGLSPLMKPAQ
jgi:hypothetical protein